MDGKTIAEQVMAEIALEVQAWTLAGGRPPHLAAIIVGQDGASQTYVGHKVKACARVGFRSTRIDLPEETTQEQLLRTVRQLNQDPEIDGFIVQLPLPKHLSEAEVIEAIDPRKDVDGFHPSNVGRMSAGLPCFLPATPAGILELLRRYQVQTAGKHCVVLGRSNIVGKPMAALLAQKGWDCTVTLCHSRTQGLEEHCQRADIIVAALGVPRFVKAHMVKPGAVVIDVGITREPDASRAAGFRLVGDVDFEPVREKASLITPVPGGVGAMTIVSLLKNTLLAARKEIFR